MQNRPSFLVSILPKNARRRRLAISMFSICCYACFNQMWRCPFGEIDVSARLVAVVSVIRSGLNGEIEEGVFEHEDVRRTQLYLTFKRGKAVFWFAPITALWWLESMYSSCGFPIYLISVKKYLEKQCTYSPHRAKYYSLLGHIWSTNQHVTEMQQN